MSKPAIYTPPIPAEEIGGYVGKILWIDLDTKQTHTLDTLDYADFFGGRAMGIRLQWEFGKKGIKDGRDPDSLLMFLTGPASGVPLPGGSRLTVCYQQVLQEPSLWATSSTAGWYAPELKQAGYDGVIMRGKSEKPCYVFIDNGEVSFHDAVDMWEWDAYRTQHYVRDQLGSDNRIRVACIGTSGAKGNALSAIMFDTCHGASQHPGAVMGAKNLKAVAVRGDGTIKVHNPQFIYDFRDQHLDCLNQGPSVFESVDPDRAPYKTMYTIAAKAWGPDVKRVYCCYGCHSCYFAWMDDNTMPKGGQTCGVTREYQTAWGVREGKVKVLTTEQGDLYTDRIRFEILENSAENLKLMTIFVKLCDAYGISAYEMLGMRTPNNLINHMYWSGKASPAFKEWLEREVGFEYGSIEFLRRYTEMVGTREGLIGEWMGDGVERAAKMLRDQPGLFGITPEDGAYAWEAYQRCYPIHGSFEHHFYRPTFADPRDDPRNIRISPIATLIYCMGSMQMGKNNHACSEIYEESQSNSRGQCYKNFYDERAACRYLDKNGEPLIFDQLYLPDTENFYTLDNRISTPVKANFTKGTPLATVYAMAQGLYEDTMCACDFILPMVAGGQFNSLACFSFPKTPDALAKLADPDFISHPEWSNDQFTEITGISQTLEEFYHLMMRALLLERAVQVRDSNRSRDANDKPNPMFMKRLDKSGINIDEDELNRGLGIVYELLGCDPESGVPTEKGLRHYGLQWVADELESLGRLSHYDISTGLLDELLAEGAAEFEKNKAYAQMSFEAAKGGTVMRYTMTDAQMQKN
jgi:hypothetical protein